MPGDAVEESPDRDAAALCVRHNGFGHNGVLSGWGHFDLDKEAAMRTVTDFAHDDHVLKQSATRNEASIDEHGHQSFRHRERIVLSWVKLDDSFNLVRRDSYTDTSMAEGRKQITHCD